MTLLLWGDVNAVEIEANELDTIESCKAEIKKLKESIKKQKVADDIVNWLADNININMDKKPTNKEIEDMLNNQLAVSYLLLWPLMEQRYFSGFLKINQIENAADKISRFYQSELANELDCIAKHFLTRYNRQNQSATKTMLKKLSPHQNSSEKVFLKIFTARYYSEIEPYPSTKLKLILYVIYRYRNNIFHGSKSIETWTQFDTEINYCLKAMMLLMDCMKKNNIIIEAQ